MKWPRRGQLLRPSVFAILTFCFAVIASATAFGNLDFQGGSTFQVSGNTVHITLAKIVNSSSTRTSGSLRIDLWAFQAPYAGGSFSGYKTASVRTSQITGLSDQLGPSRSFSDITLDLPYTAPAPGYSSYSLFLMEFSNACTASDHFCVTAYLNYSSPPTNYTFSGIVADRSAGRISNATVTLTGNSKTFTAVTDGTGNFSLTFDRTGIPSTVAFTVTKTGYIPLASPLTLNSSNASNVGTLTMDVQGIDVVAVEVVPDLHHLGDDFFGGSVNSQFQRSAEGISFSRTFTVTSTQKTGTSATITLLAKGLQENNPLRVNGTLVGYLNSSPDDGSFGPVTFNNVPISFFREGANTLTIASSEGLDYDDFEFTNVVIRFNNITTPPVTPVPALISISSSSGNQGSTVSATIAGTNLTGATAVSFSGSGVTATINSGASSTSLPVSITILSGAATGARTLTVTTPAGTSVPFNGFTITAGSTPGSSTVSYSVPLSGGMSTTSQGGSGTASVGYARIQPSSGNTTASGLAIFGFRQNNVLVSEAGVPASPLIRSGRIFAEVSGPVNTGLAIANPNNEAARVTFFFTDANGNFGNGSTSIPANGQIASFLDQAPFNGRSSLSGSFTFNSSVPISVIAIRGYTNERAEFLITTLPVADLAAAPSFGTIVFPHFAEGGGWTTQIVLVNPTDNVLTGSVQFRDQAGQASNLSVAGRINNSFSYSIPAHGSQKLQTSGTGSTILSGSVRATPAANGPAPSGLVIFSFRNNGKTVAEAGVPVSPVANAFRMYAEASGDFNNSTVGSMQTGVAIANNSGSTATVNLELNNLDGSSTGLTGTLQIPANGQVATFLNQIAGFASLPLPFQGVLRVSSSASIAMVGLRGRYNERNDFLFTTTPPVNEAAPPSSSTLFFPHIADGGGYTTQFLLFSGQAGQTSSGTVQFFSQSGGTLALSLGPSGSVSLKNATGAAWSLNPAERRLTTIAWVNRDGAAVQSRAYRGEVAIIVDPARVALSNVQTLVSQRQGNIYAQLPVQGLYWITVAAGSEASFIAAVRNAVTDALPVLAVTSRQTIDHLTLPLNYDESTATALPLSLSSGDLVADDFTIPMCVRDCETALPVYIQKNFDGSFPRFKETTDPTLAAAHGDITSFLSTDFALQQNTFDLVTTTLAPTLEPESSQTDGLLAIASAIRGAANIGKKLVVNYSWGFNEYKKDDPDITQEQRTNWEVYNQNNAFEEQEEFAAVLNADVPGTRDAIIVQASGNSGTNLTSTLVRQQTLHPTASKQIVEVGALDCTDAACTGFKVANYSNYSSAAGTMIYVPVTFTTDTGFPVEGTSFAAPQIKYLVSQIRKSRPDLTPDQIRQVLFDPSVAPIQNLQLPNGTTFPVPVIADPLCKGAIPNVCVLQTALGVANRLFPTSMFTLAIVTTGTGAGTVAASPVGVTYPVGTIVTLTANPASGSTFTGWSGACSGTSATCTLSMNSNKSVTAAFSLLPTYILTTSTAGTGSGVISPPGGNYASGTAVTLTATPAAGSTFTGWSGACTGTGSCVVTMNSNKAVTATFTLSGGSGGSLTGTWSGTWTRQFSGLCDAETNNITWTITHTGASITGTLTRVITATDADGLCPYPVGTRLTDTFVAAAWNVTASLNGSTLTLITAGGTKFIGTVSGTTITGTGGNTAQSGGFTALTAGPFTVR
jgi:hypothetical protein